MLTIGIALVIQELLIMIWGGAGRAAPIIADGATMILGVYVLNQQLYSSAIAIVILFLLALLIYKTKFGIVMRAVSENPAAGEIVGVDNRRVYIVRGRLWTIVPASIIIGFAEVLIVYAIPGGAYLKRSIALGFMLLVIIFRPQGIAGLRGWGAY
jgi:branched-chain amino acid transport system permease protein